MQDNETFAFSADINQLLSLIINTFYTNKDVFLRELICNASDALDKLRYTALTNPDLLDEKNPLEIRIIPDKMNNTITIEDSGIGMTKEDLVNNLGTIAKSGTKAFMEALQAGADMSMIGQFGVGFYSAFLVAEKVTVTSRCNEDCYKWESSGGGSFTIQKDVNDMNRGTKIILHLKEDMISYMEESKLKGLIKTHSEFIDFPIKLLIETIKDESTEVNVEDDKQEAKKISVYDWEHLNQQKPIWLRNPNEISEDEYNAFYKSLTNDWDDPICSKQFSVEGQLEFKSVLFIPKKAPFDAEKKQYNQIKLYVRRVFIMDNCEDLLPEWLSFIKGIVDSEDLPLNISRETLQQNKILKVIRKNLIKKSIDMMNELSEDNGKYKLFYESFSKNIKLGIHEDATNRTKLSELLRFTTSKNTTVSLKDYINRMPETQQNIYYITGETILSITNSPCMEQLKRKNYEVIFMTDAIDEYMMQQLKEFDNKKMVCITKDVLELDQTKDDKDNYDNSKKEFEPLCSYIKNILKDSVEKVVISNRLYESPCVLVTGEFGWTANMERIMRSQTLHNNNNNITSKKTFEINPLNVIIKHLNNTFHNYEKDDTILKNLIWLLYNTTLITSGFSLDNPTEYTNQINRLIKIGLDINEDIDEIIEEDVVDVSDDTTEDDIMEQVD